MTSDQMAAGLQAVGVKRGDRVVVQLENSIEAVISLFAVLKAGAVFVPLGRTVKADKLSYILNDCEATVLVADPRVRQVVRDTLRAASVATTVLTEIPLDETESLHGRVLAFQALLQLSAPVATCGATIDCDLAALVYTSGSTGRPKGVMLTHANIMAAVRSISSYLKNTRDDVILNVMPLSFDYGLYQVFLAFE